jgi:hypothetical protein
MEEELLKEALPEVEEVLDKEEELDIYTEEGIEDYAESDEISPAEQGFMQGYLGG